MDLVIKVAKDIEDIVPLPDLFIKNQEQMLMQNIVATEKLLSVTLLPLMDLDMGAKINVSVLKRQLF
ncbi:MAG: hypothetical protein QM802_08365 [Agriterribacter sp.]